MKSLNKIQKISKVFKIIFQVIMILTIVMACYYVFATIIVLALKDNATFLDFLKKYVLSQPEEDVKLIVVKMVASAIISIGNAVIFGFTVNYLNSELKDGTPFTESGAKKLLKLGIRYIYIPIITLIVAAILAAILSRDDVNINSNLPSLAYGIILIMLSFVFRYGAELEQKVKATNQEKEESSENSDQQV